MVEMEGVIKKWGNSYGILVPKKKLEEAGLKVNQKVDFLVTPKSTASKLYGILKGKRKHTSQEIKDWLREELYDD